MTSQTTTTDKNKTLQPTTTTNNNNFQSNKISQSERLYILQGCSANFRIDGRKCTDLRPYNLTTTTTTTTNTQSSNKIKAPLLLLSNGSSRVSLPGSSTDILTSIKAEIVPPKPGAPDRGVIDYNVDFFSTNGVGGGGGGGGMSKKYEMELSQLLTRLFWSNVNELDLIILPGKYCWKISIDVMVLAFDGGSAVVDVISMGVYAALNGMVLPRVTVLEKEEGEKDEFLVEGELNARPEAVTNCPVIVTVCVLKGVVGGGKRRVLVLDANCDEEECADMKVSVAVDDKGFICGAYTHGGGGGGGSSVPFKMLGEVMDVAKKGAKVVFEKVLKNNDGDIRDGEQGGRGGDLLHGHFRIR